MPNRKVQQAIETALRAQLAAVRSVGSGLITRIGVVAEQLASLEGSIIVTGAGKSGHVARKIAATLVSLGVPSSFLHPNDAVHGDIGILTKRDAVLAISHSGATVEVMRVVRHAVRCNIPIFVITGNEKSILANASAVTLNYSVRDEGSPHGLAPMASTTASLVIGDLLASAISTRRGFTKEHFANAHPGGSLGLQLRQVQTIMRTGTGIPWVAAKVSFADAVSEINDSRMGIVAVLGKGMRLMGVLTDGDIRRYISNPKFRMSAPIGSVMTKRPIAISPDASLWDALYLMEEKHITSLYVARKGLVCGFVHLHDLLEHHEV